MKDLIKRSILKTLREFSKLNVVPTIEDLFVSLDTSEFKNPSIKRPLFDEAFDELVQNREVLAAEIDEIILAALPDVQTDSAKDVVNYRRSYRKDVRDIVVKLEYLKKFGFVLNISTLNLLPAKEGPEIYIYIFVKNNSRKIVKFLTKTLLIGKGSWIRHIKILEYNDVKLYFPEKQVQSAYKLANLRPVINKNNFYENLIYQNRWVFEILGNFPVSRISLNYKGTNKKDNFDSSFVTKMFNKIFV